MYCVAEYSPIGFVEALINNFGDGGTLAHSDRECVVVIVAKCNMYVYVLVLF